MKDIYQIVKDEIHAKMNLTINVESVTLVSTDTYALVVCSLKWARKGLTIVDELNHSFVISEVDPTTNTIIVVGSFVWSGNGIIQAYKFFVGTPISTNEEWKAFNKDERKKVPFIWLVEPTSERFATSENSLERTSDLRLIFLDDNFARKWLTTEVHENRLQSVYNCVEQFILTIQNNPIFGNLPEYDLKNFTRFGTESTNGFTANIIDADLTGVELRLSLPIYKLSECNC